MLSRPDCVELLVNRLVFARNSGVGRARSASDSKRSNMFLELVPLSRARFSPGLSASLGGVVATNGSHACRPQSLHLCRRRFPKQHLPFFDRRLAARAVLPSSQELLRQIWWRWSMLLRECSWFCCDKIRST